MKYTLSARVRFGVFELDVQSGELRHGDGSILLWDLTTGRRAPGQPAKKRTSFFGDLRTPALFVHGTADPFGAPEELREAVARLNKAIALCLSKQDAGTRELLEELLEDEEESVDYLEAQLKLVEDVGRERYLSEQLRE